MSIHLEPGTFYAGVNLPFFITENMVRDKIESAGLTNVVFHKRSESSPPVNPEKYPQHSDDWDTWISADYAGPKKDLDVAKHWAWLLVVPKKDVSSSAKPPPPTSPDFTVKTDKKQTLIALGALSALALLLLMHSSKQVARVPNPFPEDDEKPND